MARLLPLHGALREAKALVALVLVINLAAHRHPQRQLGHETLVGRRLWAVHAQRVERVAQGEAHAGAHEREHDGGRARVAMLAVHEDAAAFVDGGLDEVDGVLQAVQQVGLCAVLDVQPEVLAAMWWRDLKVYDALHSRAVLCAGGLL